MFFKKNRKQYPLALVCEVLQVSQSGYHNWLKNKVSRRENENQRLLEIIWFHHNKSKGTYALPRVYAAIRKEGLFVNKKRIARLMKVNNIKAKTKRRFKVTTVQDSKAQPSENILKQNFTALSENKI
jgi:putative transposase